MHCRDLGESFPTSIYYLLAKFGFDTAENERCKICPLSVYRDLVRSIIIIIYHYYFCEFSFGPDIIIITDRPGFVKKLALRHAPRLPSAGGRAPRARRALHPRALNADDCSPNLSRFFEPLGLDGKEDLPFACLPAQ